MTTYFLTLFLFLMWFLVFLLSFDYLSSSSGALTTVGQLNYSFTLAWELFIVVHCLNYESLLLKYYIKKFKYLKWRKAKADSSSTGKCPKTSPLNCTLHLQMQTVPLYLMNGWPIWAYMNTVSTLTTDNLLYSSSFTKSLMTSARQINFQRRRCHAFWR